MDTERRGAEMGRVLGALAQMQNFERLSVRLYQTQLPAYRSKHFTDTLDLLLDNERGHVDNLGRRLEELGGTASRVRLFFDMAGNLIGLITVLLGRKFILKADIWIEEQAVKGYQSFLKKAPFDARSRDIIQSNISDEIVHIQKFQKLQEFASNKH
jgi:bacterioferritin